MNATARGAGLHRNELDGQVVLYDEQSDRVHLLDPTTAAVFDLLDGHRSEAEIARLVGERLRVPAEAGLVQLAILELRNSGLLVEESRGARAPEISRRELVRRMGLSGALAVLVPAIVTVGIPSPASAQSGTVPIGGTCFSNGVCQTGCCGEVGSRRNTCITRGEGTCYK